MVWFHEDDICKHYKIFGDQVSFKCSKTLDTLNEDTSLVSEFHNHTSSFR